MKRVIMRLSWLAALALMLSLASLPATHSPAYAYENTKDGLNSSGAGSPESDEFAELDKIDTSDVLPPAKAFVVTTRVKMNVTFAQFVAFGVNRLLSAELHQPIQRDGVEIQQHLS